MHTRYPAAPLVQVREAKVRRAGIGGRARLAGELRDMDDEVRNPLNRSAISFGIALLLVSYLS